MTSTVAAEPKPLTLLAARVEMGLTYGMVAALIATQWATQVWDTSFRRIFSGLLIAAIAVVLIGRADRLRSLRFEVGLTAALGITVLGSIAANMVTPSVAIRGAFPYLVWPVVLLAGLAARTRRASQQRAARLATWLIATMGVIALAQLAFGEPAYVWLAQDVAPSRWWEHGRAVGLVANPVSMGHIGVLGLGLLALPVRSRWAVVGLVAVVVAGGGSRNVLLAIVLGLLSLVAFRRAARVRWLAAGMAGSLALFALIPLLVPESRQSLEDRVSLLTKEAAVDANTGEANADPEVPSDLRVANFRAGTKAWRAAPILGHGPGRFGSTTAWDSGSELHDEYELFDASIGQIDLGWVQMLAEIGALGVILSLALLGLVALRCIRARAPVPFILLLFMIVLTVGSPALVNAPIAAAALWWVGLTTPDRAVPAA